MHFHILHFGSGEVIGHVQIFGIEKHHILDVPSISKSHVDSLIAHSRFRLLQQQVDPSPCELNPHSLSVWNLIRRQCDRVCSRAIRKNRFNATAYLAIRGFHCSSLDVGVFLRLYRIDV
jgi:hypothetical protein